MDVFVSKDFALKTLV